MRIKACYITCHLNFNRIIITTYTLNKLIGLDNINIAMISGGHNSVLDDANNRNQIGRSLLKQGMSDLG